MNRATDKEPFGRLRGGGRGQDRETDRLFLGAGPLDSVSRFPFLLSTPLSLSLALSSRSLPAISHAFAIVAPFGFRSRSLPPSSPLAL